MNLIKRCSNWIATSGRSAIRLVVLLAVVAGPTQSVLAQSDYDVTHTFDLNFPRGANVFGGTWTWFTDAYARSTSQGVIVDHNADSVQFVGPIDRFELAHAISGSAAEAEADASIHAAPTSMGVQGWHRISGFTSITGDGRHAIAMSESAVEFRMGARAAKGKIKWGPRIRLKPIRKRARIGDPVVVKVTDLDTNVTIESTLFSIDFASAANPGELVDGSVFSWEAGVIHVQGLNGHFVVNMESPYLTSAQGAMSMTFERGVVITSEDSGVFDGWLPPVNALAVLDAQFGDPEGNIDLDFDMGPENVNGYDVTTDFGGDGEFDREGGGGYTLTVTGVCPGAVNVAWSGAPANTTQGIVFGNSLGSTTIPSGPCQGLVLGMSGGIQLITTISTGNGSGAINGNAASGACHHYLQLVAVGSPCTTSNVAQIP